MMTMSNDLAGLVNLDDTDDLDPSFAVPSLVKKSQYFDINDFGKLTSDIPMSNSLSIMNTNARSLVKHFAEYQITVNSLYNKNFKYFDILSFTETWLDESLENLVNLDGYTSVFKHKKTMKEGGGIAIYVNRNLNFFVRQDIIVPVDKQHLFDCLFVEIKQNNPQSRNIILGVIYRSPSFNSQNEFITCMDHLLSSVSSENKELVIVGDVNIDLLKYKQHIKTNEYLDMLLCNGLLPAITLPTRVTHACATLIDHVFIKNTSEYHSAGTLTTDISDHFINFIFIKNQIMNKSKPSYVTYRSFSKDKVKKLSQDLKHQNWNDILCCNDVNLAYNKFLSIYQNLIEKHMPLKKVRFNPKKHKINSWITKGLLTSIKTKDRLFNKLKRTSSLDRYNILKEKYTNYRNKLNSLIRVAKKLYWDNQFQCCKNDIKETWKNINKIIKGNNDKSGFPETMQSNSGILNNPQEIADGFNSFYVNIGPQLSSNIHSSTDPTTYLPNVNLPNSFMLFLSDHNEVKEVIMSLRPKLSSGFDSISPKLLKETHEGVVAPLLHIINLSLATGIVPDKTKIAKVVPIHKSGSKSMINNYRPVSLLPTFSKILEKIVYKRLYSYFITNNILTESQYGFRKSRSTNLALLELQNRIIHYLSKNEFCVGFFVDLSKAFDTLNHSILLSKMAHYGVRGTALSWFESYLKDRSQFIEIDKVSSHRQNISCGVPQGSILGPLLFLLYINDITRSCNSCDMVIFADDTNLLFHHKDSSYISDLVNAELQGLNLWFKANKLSLNITKTKYIHFKTKQNDGINLSPIKIENQLIDEVTSIRFLGVILSHNLSWKDHIDNISTKITKVVSILSRLKYTIPEHSMLNIYNALIVPHLSYSIESWGDAPHKLTKRIITLQKKAVRAVTKSKFNSHTNPIFMKYKILKFADIFKLHCVNLYYRKQINILPSYLSNMLQSFQHNDRSTRQSNDIYINHISNKLEKQSLNFKVGNAWNDLPTFLKSIKQVHLKTFSKRVKSHFLSSYKSNICTQINCFPCAQSSSQS